MNFNFHAAGTKAERGLIAWEKEMELTGAGDASVDGNGDIKQSTYDFPYGMDLLRR